MKHSEIAKKAGVGMPCTAHDIIIVSEGLQCANCGALTRDHMATWESPKDRREAQKLPNSFEVSPGRVNRGGCY
jgi:hypothetical protein